MNSTEAIIGSIEDLSILITQTSQVLSLSSNPQLKELGKSLTRTYDELIDNLVEDKKNIKSMLDKILNNLKGDE